MGLLEQFRKWTELYRWLMQDKESEWAGRLISYMAVLEQKLVRGNYLREGTLTVFAGIPFGKDEPTTITWQNDFCASRWTNFANAVT